MANGVLPRRMVRFGEFVLDQQAGRLLRRGAKIRLREQSLQVLAELLDHAGEVVTREHLQQRLWPGEPLVDVEINLNTAIARLREALHDSAERPRFIETLPRHGYRFIGSVEVPVVAAAHAPTTRARIVVLPVANRIGDPAQEYFSDAMTDELITALCRVAPRRLAVIARTTAMHYKQSRKDVAHIGRELRVDYAVEGGVRRSGDRLAINVQLVQTADQSDVFAQRYDGDVREVFQMVNRVAADIAASIGVTEEPGDGAAGLPDGGQLRKKPTGDPAAYNEYIQGRYHLGKLCAEGFALAKEHLERAIARDPEFALAYDALAEVHWYLGYLGHVPPREAFSAGIVHALRAVEIDGTLAETHALLGEFHKTIEYDWPEVRREMDLALRLDPGSPTVRLRNAVSGLMPHGRLEEAIAELELALESDPLSMLAHGWLGIMLVLAHRWDPAIDQAHRLLQLFPGVFWGHFVLGVAYREKQRYDEAIAALRTAAEVSGAMPLAISWLGLTLAVSGQAAEARSLLAQLHAAAAKGHVPPTSFAWIHLGLGETDAAFEWLDRAVDECDQLMMPIKTYKFFDPLRGDPRFLALLRKMKLET